MLVTHREATLRRVAIPISGTRVSPLFDVARTLLLADIEAGRVTNRSRQEVATDSAPARARLLADLNVAELVCGGISRPVAMTIRAHGIRLVPWVAGEIEEVLMACAANRLPSPQFVMPGCGRRGRRRGWRGGDRHGWERPF